MSRLGIDATTQPYKSGTDALGDYYIYLDRDNIPVTLRPADGGYIVQHQVGVDTREEIIRLAKLLFGEDVVCEIPSMYEDTLEVTIHGDVFIYENGTLERVSSRKDYKRLRGGQSETKDSTHHVSIHSNVRSVLPCQYYAE